MNFVSLYSRGIWGSQLNHHFAVLTVRWTLFYFVFSGSDDWD